MGAYPPIDAAILALRHAYDAFEASGELARFLRLAFSKLFELSGYATAPGSPIDQYQAALDGAFFDPDPKRRLLGDADRERVIVALLASDGSEGNLALHIYLALMEGVTPKEIAEILFLMSIYTGGIHRLTQGLKIANLVFGILVELHQRTPPGQPAPLPPQVVLRILSAFPDEKALLGDLAAATHAPPD